MWVFASGQPVLFGFVINKVAEKFNSLAVIKPGEGGEDEEDLSDQLKLIQVYLFRCDEIGNKISENQKVMLVENCFEVVGSANFDCRSMFINCHKMSLETFKHRSLLSQIASRAANLMAPVL